jgi:hypothetical protein
MVRIYIIEVSVDSETIPFPIHQFDDMPDK